MENSLIEPLFTIIFGTFQRQAAGIYENDSFSTDISDDPYEIISTV